MALFATIALLGGCGSTGRPPNDRAPEVTANIEKAQLRNQEALARFESELRKLDANYQARFSAAAYEASDKAAERQTILTTIYYLTKDKLRGGDETDAFLEQIIGPALKPVVESYLYEVNKISNDLERDLRNTSIDFATDSRSALGEQIPDAKKMAALRGDWKDFDHALAGLGYRAPYIGARVLVNVNTAVGSSVSSALVGPLKAIATKFFSKSVVRLAASTSAAIFEGPLPVGKIISAVSFLWTGYELAQLQPTYQSEVLASTKTSFDSVKSQIDKSAKYAATERVALFNKLLLDIRIQARK